jgi:hypothetical protein
MSATTSRRDFAPRLSGHGRGRSRHRLHVAFADHEHGVDFHLFGALNFAVDVIGAFVEFAQT